MLSAVAMHPDQLVVTAETVAQLTADQFPAWADLPVRDLGSPGTVNALFRLGEDLAARFPLRPMNLAAAWQWLESEADAARELCGRVPVPTPEPIAIGAPGFGYPLPWSVQTWLPGSTATPAGATSESPDFARDLAAFVSAVRLIDTRGRQFNGTNRGGDLRTRDDWVETCLINSAGLFDVARVRRLWARLRELPRVDADLMTHGDLIPGNLLVADGRLAGVLDVGGLGAADPALDLVGGWHLLAAGPREIFRTALACDDLQWARGQAWALEQALGAAWYYRRTNPAMHELGMTTIHRILDDLAEVPR